MRQPHPPPALSGAGLPWPADTSPADTSPADTSPADTSPADTWPADTAPADTSAGSRCIRAGDRLLARNTIDDPIGAHGRVGVTQGDDHIVPIGVRRLVDIGR